MIKFATKDEARDLIDFLIHVNGESNIELAKKYVECCFSNYWCSGIF